MLAMLRSCASYHEWQEFMHNFSYMAWMLKSLVPTVCMCSMVLHYFVSYTDVLCEPGLPLHPLHHAHTDAQFCQGVRLLWLFAQVCEALWRWGMSSTSRPPSSGMPGMEWTPRFSSWSIQMVHTCGTVCMCEGVINGQRGKVVMLV